MTTYPGVPETAVIGKITRNQSTMSIVLYNDPSPERAAMTLLEHYSEESQIDLLMEFGSREHLPPNPRDPTSEIEYFTTFRSIPSPNNTQEFFETYWDPCDAWIYVWTPDGWFGCRAMGHQMTSEHILGHFTSENCSSECYVDAYPKEGTPAQKESKWREMVKQFQVPEPLVKVIRDHVGLNSDHIPDHQEILDRLNTNTQI